MRSSHQRVHEPELSAALLNFLGMSGNLMELLSPLDGLIPAAG